MSIKDKEHYINFIMKHKLTKKYKKVYSGHNRKNLPIFIIEDNKCYNTHRSLPFESNNRINITDELLSYNPILITKSGSVKKMSNDDIIMYVNGIILSIPIDRNIETLKGIGIEGKYNDYKTS